MTSIQNKRGVSLSAGAVLNGWPMPPVRIVRHSGDYAGSEAGRMRRKDRRNAIARKRVFIGG